MPELSGPGESWAGNVQGKLIFFVESHKSYTIACVMFAYLITSVSKCVRGSVFVREMMRVSVWQCFAFTHIIVSIRFIIH